MLGHAKFSIFYPKCLILILIIAETSEQSQKMAFMAMDESILNQNHSIHNAGLGK